MRILRTEKQKDNLAKFFWDMAKVAFTLLVVSRLAAVEGFSLPGLVAGIAIGFVLVLLGHFLDGREVLK
ncbi:MAG TPA: hypothetical protein VNL14_21415 [Candidatus Acidoferrales bacterium]|nr:hypothetical protein [Candidatus Acidoferrales bacterium]